MQIRSRGAVIAALAVLWSLLLLAGSARPARASTVIDSFTCSTITSSTATGDKGTYKISYAYGMTYRTVFVVVKANYQYYNNSNTYLGGFSDEVVYSNYFSMINGSGTIGTAMNPVPWPDGSGGTVPSKANAGLHAPAGATKYKVYFVLEISGRGVGVPNEDDSSTTALSPYRTL